MNKTKSFRSRKVDLTRILLVRLADKHPDLEVNLNAQRSVPQVETGVEKDEEAELHLQAALEAAASTVPTAAPVYIPTPDASRRVPDYEELYDVQFQRPHTYIRFSSTVDDCCGILYTLNEEDQQWLDAWRDEHQHLLPGKLPKDPAEQEAGNGEPPNITFSEDLFELLMDILEDLAERKRISPSTPYRDCVTLMRDRSNHPSSPYTNVAVALTELPAAVEAVFGYWCKRRSAHGNRSIMPCLKMEEGPQKDADPYVCFRRRELKPLRKTRRTDAQSLEKLRNLRTELQSACVILDYVDRRERMRRESLALDRLCFDQKMAMRNLRRNLDYKDETDGLYRPGKKPRKIDTRSAGHGIGKQVGGGGGATALPGDGEDAYRYIQISSIHDELFAKRIEEELLQRRARDAGWCDMTEDPFLPMPVPFGEQCFRTLDQRSPFQFRRRLGRGGRVFLDRRLPHVSPQNDPQNLSTSAAAAAAAPSAAASWTNACASTPLAVGRASLFV